MTRVKICGITNLADARAAVDAGADALGFIRVPESPRFVDGSIYPIILYALPPFVQSVAVIRQCEEEDFPFSILDFDAVQYYRGDCTRTVTGKTFCIRAFSVEGEASLETIRQGIEWSRPDAVLLDTFHKDKLGGSGETFDWKLAVEAKKLTDKPVILAGGLTPENVTDALEIVRPYAVDVSSGVEISPGVKDHAKMRAFVRAVRTWDLRRIDEEAEA